MAGKPTKLTPKQRRFVEEYLVDLNATQAAIRAGYCAKTAESQASRLLRNVKVAAAIHEAAQTRAERTKITQQDGLRVEAMGLYRGAGAVSRETPRLEVEVPGWRENPVRAPRAREEHLRLAARADRTRAVRRADPFHGEASSGICSRAISPCAA